MKYSHFLDLMKQTYSPDREQIYNDVISQKDRSGFKIFAIICAIVIFITAVGAGAFYGFNSLKFGKENHLPEELYGISPITAVTATETKNGVVMQNSAFEITTFEAHSAEEIYDLVEISPDVSYKVKKTSGNTFTLTTDEHLSGNTLYKISSKVGNKTAYSWAFQTEKKFEITASSGGTKKCVSMFSTGEIWVEFSHSDVKNFEQYFSITPAVPGTFEQYGKRWVFIPSSDYTKNTVYTVTISKDIMNADGQTLGKDYSFNVFSCVGNTYVDCINQWNDCEIFLSTEQPRATFEYQNIDVSRAKVSIYRTSSAATFISIHNKYVKGGTVSSSITEQFSKESSNTFEAQLTVDEQKHQAHLTYPEPLKAGFYITQVEFGDVVTYHLFEVSDYSIYSSVSNGIISLWVNDPVTQKGVQGIAVADEHANITTTDANGVAQINCQGKTDLVYLNISTPTPSAIIIKPKQSKGGHEFYNNFTSMRTDRTAYNAGDTVKLWGITVKKDTGAKTIYEIKPSWAEKATKITPDNDGVFTADIETDVIGSQSGYIDLLINGEVVNTCYIDVYKQSPKYCVDISTDKDIYVEGQTVTFTAYVTLYDKTPVENVRLTLDGREFVTNSRGLATITETAGAGGVRTIECDAQQYFTEYKVVKSNVYISKVTRPNDNTLDVFVKSVDNVTADATVEVQSFSGNTPIESVTATTQNGYAQIEFIVKGSPSHYVIKTANDSYTYNVNNVQNSDAQYALVTKNEYNVGDTVNMTLVDKATSTAVHSGKVLLTLAYNNTIKNIVCDANAISFDFAKEYSNGVTIHGAFFNGTTLYKTADTAIYKKQTPLEIITSFDKETYAPGDTVNVTFDVMGYDKSPVLATLNVNVHDSRLSFETKNANNDYSAPLYFDTVKTDGAGHATLSFVLPSGVQDWKMDAVAFDSKQNTGKLQKDVKVDAPMYIDTFISKSVYDTDDVSFAFRVNGNGVGESYNYTAVLLKDGVQIASKEGFASKEQVKNESFGRVDTTGTVYTIKVSAASNSVTAESEAQFEFVKKSNVQTSLTLQNNLTVKSEAYTGDVAISVYDPEYALYFKVIDKMLGKSSNRVDHILAYAVANSIAKGNDIGVEQKRIISNYITAQGVYIYPAANVATVPQAALISVVANELSDKAAVKEYFDGVLKGKPDTLSLIASNAALASLGEPVLNELNALYEGIENYSNEQKLFLTLGFACAGDHTTAYKILGTLTQHIKTANGTASFEADTPVATEYMSCIAAIVTSKLSQNNAKDLVKGVINSADSTLSGLAYCEFVTNCCIHLDGKNAVIFKDAEGKEQTFEYYRTDHVTFNVAKDDIERIKITNKSDENFACIATSTDTDGYTAIKDVQSSIITHDTLVNDGGRVTLTATFSTENCKMENGYAKLSLPHGLKFVNATITNGVATVVNDGGVYIYKSTAAATVQIECYAALEGKYTVSAPTVYDRGSKQKIEGNPIEITVQ